MNYSLESPLGRESSEVRIILLLYFTENPLLSTIMLFVSNHHVFIQEQKTLTLTGLHCQHQNFLTISGYHCWQSLQPSYELISCRAFRAPITVLCSNNGKKGWFGRRGVKSKLLNVSRHSAENLSCLNILKYASYYCYMGWSVSALPFSYC